MSNITKRRIFVSIIILTLIFIWGQSCLSREQSGMESEAVRSWLENIFVRDTALSRFVLKYTRKIAHFAEFGILGIEMTLFTYICTKKKLRDIIYAAAFGPLVAIIDETIQKFSDRGSSFVDVIIDIAGYFTVSFFCILVCTVIKQIKKGNKKYV